MLEKEVVNEQISLTSTLHTEILLQIINQIRFDNIQNNTGYPLKSLYSCALVNKHWCCITIPLLYKTIIQSHTNSGKLFEILIKFLDQEQIQELTDLGINIKEDFKERSVFNYLSFIKELDFSNLMRIICEFVNGHYNELNDTFFVYQKENNIKKYVVRVNINEENNNVDQGNTSTISANETESTLYDTITVKDTIIACKPSKMRDKRLLSLVRKPVQGKLTSDVKNKIIKIRTEVLLTSLLNIFIKYDVIIKKLSFKRLKPYQYDFLLKNEKALEWLGESVNEVNVKDFSGIVLRSGLLKVLEKKFENLKSLNIFLLSARDGIYNKLDLLIKSQPTLTSLHFTDMEFSRLVRTIFYNSRQIRHLQFENCKFTQIDRFDCIFSCDNLITLSFTRCKSINDYIEKWTAMESYDYVDKYGLIQNCFQLSKRIKKVQITERKRDWTFSERNGENNEKIIIDNVYENFVNWLQKSEGFKNVEKYNYFDFSKCEMFIVKEFKR